LFGNLSLGGAVQTPCVQANAATTPALIARRNAACALGIFSPTTGAELAYNFYFQNDGTLLRDNPTSDLRANGGGIFGGYSATGVEGAMLLPGLDRINTNVLLNFEFSPALQFFGEGKYVKITNNQTSTQPTFVNSTLSPTFQVSNPFLSDQARQQILTALGPTATTFTFFRFNNDIGTRAEDHHRETYRFVGGFRGDLGTESNLRYEIAGTYGRTNTNYEAGGNVDVAKFNAAANAVRNAAGQIVCGVNADAITTNDLPGCVPLNLFGQNNSSQAARDYVLYTSRRDQWASEINAIASVSGDSGALFSLPAGNIGFALGAEYRKEDAFSDYDDYTQAGNTFLNAFAQFDPPAVDVKEAFGEVSIPLLKDMVIHELTLNGAARYSKYSSMDKGVWAYNYSATFAPVEDIRFRAGYARSVRAPNLSDLYSTASQTFANNFVDPCSQGAPINANPNRVRNCAAAGVPTTITFTNDQGIVTTQPYVNAPSSGIVGINSGNAGLLPEVGKSFTAGAVFKPRFIRGLTLSVDYYNIEVTNVISGLSGQGIVNQCYDDPVGIANPYCAAIFRRTSTNPVLNATFAGQQNRVLTGVANNSRDFVGVPVTNSFINQPFNYAKLKTSGIDADISYNHTFNNGLKFNYRTVVSWLEKRESYFFITAPDQSTRIHGTLGDPVWKGQMSVNLTFNGFDLGYDLNYIGKMAVAAWEVQHTHQGRGPTNADAFPISDYPAQDTHDVQIGYRVNKQFRAYLGVDNVADTLPPYGLTGTGAGGGIYGVVGRYFYSGVNLKF
jgi:outer membrane receptor protein involved in Fe transport